MVDRRAQRLVGRQGADVASWVCIVRIATPSSFETNEGRLMSLSSCEERSHAKPDAGATPPIAAHVLHRCTRHDCGGGPNLSIDGMDAKIAGLQYRCLTYARETSVALAVQHDFFTK